MPNKPRAAQDLVRTNNAPRAELDKANDELRRADAEMAISRSVSRSRSRPLSHSAPRWTARRRRWRRRNGAQPHGHRRAAAGSIVHLTLRVGDTATAEVPLIGIVDAASWRIIANYKQDYIRSLEIGGTAWVWLDSRPWHFHRARIGGIARGISREPGEEQAAALCCADHRLDPAATPISVTLFLVDPPPGNRLYMGAERAP